jgi:hypothetical protein
MSHYPIIFTFVLVSVVSLGGCGTREGDGPLSDAYKLSAIGKALHAYAGQHGALPKACSSDFGEVPICSWRVHVLPFLEQETLQRQYDCQQPWDSPGNLKASQQAVPILSVTPEVANGRIVYVSAIVTPQSLWCYEKIDDPALYDSRVIAVAYSRSSTEYDWTNPVDLAPEDVCDDSGIREELTSSWGDIKVLCANGAVYRLSEKTTASDLAFLTGEEAQLLKDTFLLPLN